MTPVKNTGILPDPKGHNRRLVKNEPGEQCLLGGVDGETLPFGEILRTRGRLIIIF